MLKYLKEEAKTCPIVPDSNFYWNVKWIDVAHSKYHRGQFQDYVENVHNGQERTKDRNKEQLLL